MYQFEPSALSSLRMTESVSIFYDSNEMAVTDSIKQPDLNYAQSSYVGTSVGVSPKVSQRRFTYGDIDDLFRTDNDEPCAAATCSSREILELIRRQKRKEQNRAAYVDPLSLKSTVYQ